MTVATKTILAINSHIEQLAILKIVLGSTTDWQILTATEVTEGIERAKSLQPDAILLGFIAARLRRTEDRQNFKVRTNYQCDSDSVGNGNQPGRSRVSQHQYC